MHHFSLYLFIRLFSGIGYSVGLSTRPSWRTSGGVLQLYLSWGLFRNKILYSHLLHYAMTLWIFHAYDTFQFDNSPKILPLGHYLCNVLRVTWIVSFPVFQVFLNVLLNMLKATIRVKNERHPRISHNRFIKVLKTNWLSFRPLITHMLLDICHINLWWRSNIFSFITRNFKLSYICSPFLIWGSSIKISRWRKIFCCFIRFWICIFHLLFLITRCIPSFSWFYEFFLL